jgi:hypothetical protein
MSHDVILDYFERARSDGMGGAITLRKCKEGGDGNIFVVGRMDQMEYGCLSNDRPVFGDDLEVRTFVELKYQVIHPISSA